MGGWERRAGQNDMREVGESLLFFPASGASGFRRPRRLTRALHSRWPTHDKRSRGRGGGMRGRVTDLFSRVQCMRSPLKVVNGTRERKLMPK
jgi:hypothetical protein